MRKFFLVIAWVWAASIVLSPADLKAENSSDTPEESASVQDVSDRDYESTLRRVIASAQKSIDISVENFSLTDEPNDPAASLIEELIRARKRGVKVRIFLNTYAETSGQVPVFLREDVLYRMRRDGVEIHFVSPSRFLRDRLVIADGQTILEGGLPWGRSHLQEGLGSGVLIQSRGLALKKKNRLEFLPLWDIEQKRNRQDEGEVSIPFYLLREIKYFPGMVTSDDGDAMKIYMALLRKFQKEQDVRFLVSFEELSREIPAGDFYEKHAVHFQAMKTLERLASNYGLIDIEQKASDQYRIRMLFPSTQEAGIRVPSGFFEENYCKELSEEALFAYLVILYRAQVSGESPVWIGSERNVEQDFPVSKERFRMGTAELREKNLIEIFPFKLKEGYKLNESLEYRYLVNPLVTLSQRLETWSRLRDQYGDDAFKRALEMAGFFGEPQDPKVVMVYLDLMKHFRLEDIAAFTERISGLPPESTPDRLTYLRTLLEHETQKNLDLAVP